MSVLYLYSFQRGPSIGILYFLLVCLWVVWHNLFMSKRTDACMGPFSSFNPSLKNDVKKTLLYNSNKKSINHRKPYLISGRVGVFEYNNLKVQGSIKPLVIPQEFLNRFLSKARLCKEGPIAKYCSKAVFSCTLFLRCFPDLFQIFKKCKKTKIE